MATSGQLTAVTRAPLAKTALLPIFASHIGGGLPLASTVSSLRSLAVVHSIVETALERVAHSELTALSASTPRIAPALLAQLDALHAELTPSLTRPLKLSLAYANEVLGDTDATMTLIGARFALLAAQPYHCAPGATRGDEAAYLAQVDALQLTEHETERVVRAAARGVAWFGQMCHALFPYEDGDVQFLVTGINPEAGQHGMPQDPREIALALRAGRAAWEQFPYLGQRFGERGVRFTSSDSCWLVWLTQLPTTRVTTQLDWLRGVLASRGIPTLILETHLRTIAAALASEFPARAEQSTRFDDFLANRDRERRALGEPFSIAIAQAESLLNHIPGFATPLAAALIASAWIDEHAGIDHALDSALDWFTDPMRFSPASIAHVHALRGTLDATFGATFGATLVAMLGATATSSEGAVEC